MRRPLNSLVLSALLAAPAFAGVTTASMSVGVPGTLSNCGPGEPPTLCDGITQASARFDFEYDDVGRTLLVTVTNTSPVVPGVPNPLIARLYFGSPSLAVTGLDMVATLTEGGGDVDFGHDFDPDLNDGDNPNTSSGFCGFNSKISAFTEIDGGIANADADTWSAPLPNIVIGPVTFVFQVSGPPAIGVTASSHARAFSQIPPGDLRVNVVAKFVEGGLAGATGSMGNLPSPETGNWAIGSPTPGGNLQFVLSGQVGTIGCLAVSDSPGPIVFPNPPYGDVIIPIGMPAAAVSIGAIPDTTTLVVNVPIPPDPNLNGLTLFAGSVLLDTAIGRLSASEGFAIQINTPD